MHAEIVSKKDRILKKKTSVFHSPVRSILAFPNTLNYKRVSAILNSSSALQPAAGRCTLLPVSGKIQPVLSPRRHSQFNLSGDVWMKCNFLRQIDFAPVCPHSHLSFYLSRVRSSAQFTLHHSGEKKDAAFRAATKHFAHKQKYSVSWHFPSDQYPPVRFSTINSVEAWIFIFSEQKRGRHFHPQ